MSQDRMRTATNLAGRVLATLIGVFIIWLAVTMAIGSNLIVPIPEHGHAPERITYNPTLTTTIARFVSAGLLGFLGVVIAAAPWRNRKPPTE